MGSYNATIGLVGQNNSGKSTFIRRYLDKQYNPPSCGTLGFFNRIQRKVAVQNNQIKLTFIDASGFRERKNNDKEVQEYNQKIMQKIPKCNGIIVAMDLTQSKGVQHVNYAINKIKTIGNNQNTPIMIVGMKSDQKKFQTEQLSKKYLDQKILFYSASALKGDNVQNIIEFMIDNNKQYSRCSVM